MAEVYLKGVKRFKQLPMTFGETVIFSQAYLKNNPSLNISVREFLEACKKAIKQYLSERAHYSTIIHLLPKTFQEGYSKPHT